MLTTKIGFSGKTFQKMFTIEENSVIIIKNMYFAALYNLKIHDTEYNEWSIKNGNKDSGC